MDEPSAVLDGEEVDNLFHLIGDLSRAGVAVVYISHRLEEIRRIGDRITVLKDGRTVATGLDARTTPTSELIRLMTGRSIEYVFPPRSGRPPAAGVEPLLSVRDLSRAGEFQDVGFDVHPGEIVGLAGLVGAGRSEIIETIFGARRADSGTVAVQGVPLRNGICQVGCQSGRRPRPRGAQIPGPHPGPGGVSQHLDGGDRAGSPSGGFTKDSAEREAAMKVAATVDVRPADPDRIVRTLSGGNQQKIVLARWLLRRCKVLLLDEPTRGVDVGARSEIYVLIRELADSGVAVVVVSSEVEEVLGLADRVLVVAGGRVLHDGPAAGINENQVLDLVMGGTAA